MDKPEPTKGKAKGIEGKYVRFALRIVGDFGLTIAIPVVFFSWVGKQLDIKYDSGPWLTILGFVLAALISAVSINRKAKQLGREFQDLDKT